MKWSWRIGKFAGIDVFMHATFLVLLGWVALSYWIAERNLLAVVLGVAFILALFLCVVLHEFGHALMARRFGVRTRDITLLPIGGLARLERIPENPWQEFWIALAGPAVNVAIAIVLGIVLLLTGGFEPVEDLSITSGSMIERILIANVVLVVFNMIPAFPMDGGRVVRALLATRFEYARATRMAANLGQSIALLFGLAGFFYNPFLVLIAFFVWIGAGQEAAAVETKSALGGTLVRDAMLTRFRAIQEDDALSVAVDMILDGSQQDFPVVSGSGVVGLLTRKELLAGLAAHGKQARVGDVMQRQFLVAEAGEPLEAVFPRMQGNAAQSIPVLDRGGLVGLLTMENIGEYLMIQNALRERSRQAAVPTLGL
jgi:Zn-dependent protease/CBS domain-containing protein